MDLIEVIRVSGWSDGTAILVFMVCPYVLAFALAVKLFLHCLRKSRNAATSSRTGAPAASGQPSQGSPSYAHHGKDFASSMASRTGAPSQRWGQNRLGNAPSQLPDQNRLGVGAGLLGQSWSWRGSAASGQPSQGAPSSGFASSMASRTGAPSQRSDQNTLGFGGGAASRNACGGVSSRSGAPSQRPNQNFLGVGAGPSVKPLSSSGNAASGQSSQGAPSHGGSLNDFDLAWPGDPRRFASSNSMITSGVSWDAQLRVSENTYMPNME